MKNKFVVALCSSAGGLDPLKSFFDSTPHDQATYIILRHVPVEHQSVLHEILQKHSKLTIKEAEDNVVIEKDFIYIPPPSTYLRIENDTLFLDKRLKDSLFPNKIADIFLKSLAAEKGKNSIAVIFSGGGSDGSRGATLIKQAGGMVIAQQPTSCEYAYMPSNAIKTGKVDYVLLPAEMPKIILHHANEVLKVTNEVRNLKKVGSKHVSQ
jgi:two-component system CheB/CheR fusion protein